MQRVLILVLACMSISAYAESIPESNTPEGVTHFFLKRVIPDLATELGKDGCKLDEESLKSEISPQMTKFVSEKFNQKQIAFLGRSYEILSSDKPKDERKREFDAYVDSLSVEFHQESGGVAILNSLSHQPFYQGPMRQKMMECIQLNQQKTI